MPYRLEHRLYVYEWCFPSWCDAGGVEVPIAVGKEAAQARESHHKS